MSPTRHTLILLILLFFGFQGLTFGCSQPPETSDNQQDTEELEDTTEDPRQTYPLLLIGVDGFHPDYFGSDYGSLPNFKQLMQGGTTAASLKPVFPTKTFVNMYSIATGLYAENHGIVGNTVYDPGRNAYLRMSDAETQGESHWWGGEPIWITAERQNIKAGTFFWVGSEAEINGYRPSHWAPYDSSIPYRDRVDQVVQWFSGDDPVQFATLYFPTVDGAGHAGGPRSTQVFNAVQAVDQTLGYLIEKLDEAGLWPEINILIVSDHGMVALDENKRIMLDEIINLSDANIIEWSPVAMLTPRTGKSQQVYEQLDADNPYREHYQLYRKEEMPDELHFKNHERIPEIIVIANLPYAITNHSFTGHTRGGHGYSPEYPEMHGIFLAHGPDFKEGHTTDTLHLVDLYELMTYLLDLEPAENDGDFTRIGPKVLKEQ